MVAPAYKIYPMYQNHHIKTYTKSTHEIKSHKNKDIIFDKQKATPPVYGY